MEESPTSLKQVEWMNTTRDLRVYIDINVYCQAARAAKHDDTPGQLTLFLIPVGQWSDGTAASKDEH